MFFENLVCLFMLLLSIAGGIYTQSFTKANAKILPDICFIVIIVLTLIILIGNIIKNIRLRSEEPVSISKIDEANKLQLSEQIHSGILLAIKIVIMLAYFLSFNFVNYFISTPIVIIAIGLLSEIDWKKVALTAIIVTALIYVVFIVWLNVFIA